MSQYATLADLQARMERDGVPLKPGVVELLEINGIE